MSALDRTFTAPLELSPAKGGHTYVVMPGSAEFFGTRGPGEGARHRRRRAVRELVHGARRRHGTSCRCAPRCATAIGKDAGDTGDRPPHRAHRAHDGEAAREVGETSSSTCRCRSTASSPDPTTDPTTDSASTVTGSTPGSPRATASIPLTYRPDGPSAVVFDEMMATGAVLVGRRTFDIAGHWDGDHHDGVPIFVPTHHPPDRPADRRRDDHLRDRRHRVGRRRRPRPRPAIAT